MDPAFQSPLRQVTIEFDATVTTVSDGAVPAPVFVLFTAGVAASCAPDQRSTHIECIHAAVVVPDDTVILELEPTTAVMISP